MKKCFKFVNHTNVIFLCVYNSSLEDKVIESVRHHIKKKNPNNGVRELWWLLSGWQSGSLVRLPLSQSWDLRNVLPAASSPPLSCSSATVCYFPLSFFSPSSCFPFLPASFPFLFLSSYIPFINFNSPFDFIRLTPSFSPLSFPSVSSLSLTYSFSF